MSDCSVLYPAQGGVNLAHSAIQGLPTRPLQNEESLEAMKKTKLTRTLLAACSIVALSAVMYGCTGDGAENDLKATQGDLKQITKERDAALAEVERLMGELATANTNLANTQTALDTANTNLETANGNVTRLTGELETANGNVTRLTGELATANGNVTRLTGELETANGNVTRLTGELETANGNVTRLEGELMTAQGNASDLRMQLETANGNVTRLTGELETANGNVTRLTGELETANGNVTRLTGELGDANTMIGSMDDAPDAEGSLHAQINAAKARVTELETKIGSMDDDADDSETASLYAQLKAAKARIAALEGGTDPAVLNPVKKAAMDAATAANAAYMKADEAAKAAEKAAMNRATIQTGMYDSGMDAKEARKQADMAKAEAGKAKAASDLAQEAENTATAGGHRDTAKAAQMAAEKAQMAAEEAKKMADKAAMMELKIDGKTKSVGGTSITVDGGPGRSVVSGGKLVETGLIDSMKITTPGMRTVNGLPVLWDQNDDGTATPVSDRTAADADIGVTYDSADDSARLTLITSYLGTQKQMQFLRTGDDDVFDGQNGAPDFDVPSDGQNLAPLSNGSITVPANAGPNTAAITGIPRVAGSQFYAADMTDKASVLYYLPSKVRDVTTGAGNTMDDGIDQTKIFLERNVVSGAVTYNVVAVIEVTLDAPASYEHLHFGLWNGLSGSGMNTVSDLGIAFAHAIADGDGLTEVMPNHGNATYNGNYVANVRAADADGDGAITRLDGTAMIMADFDDNDIDITLSGLAKFMGGKIDGNMFSGTKMSLIDTVTATTDVVDGAAGLKGDGDFTGKFSGGFFGPVGREAGGTFDYTSDDMEDGEFRGSFGGRRK